MVLASCLNRSTDPVVWMSLPQWYVISMYRLNEPFKFLWRIFLSKCFLVFSYPNSFYGKLKDIDIEQCMSTPRMSCERVMSTDCSFEDDNTTYISTWPKQDSAKDCENKCKLTTIPECHFWMHHWSNETCDLYERDKRACHSVGGPASLTGLYCTGMT